ncbi:hypothetical protein PMAYCL1PPCAC_30340, partial [Pristionchus mayeri]
EEVSIHPVGDPIMTTTSALLLTLLMMATSGAAADGRFSVQLRLSALSETPVTTTIVLQGEAHQPLTVSSHNTQSLTIDFKMNSGQVLDNEPILLDVSVRTDKDFKMETVHLDRVSPQVHSIGGFISIASSESKCAKNYYGPFCSWNCAPNEKMHLACTPEGERICMEGWQGPKCDQQVCPIACKNGGACDGGRCRCPEGFSGAACEQCVPAVGCLNGACHNNKTGTCACREGWSGALCNIDLSMCSKERSPCASDETCVAKAPGRTLCIRTKDNSGTIGSLDNRKQCPCKNGGSCLSSTGRSSSPICSCPFGFGGRFCEQSTVPVETAPDAQSTIKYFIVAHALTCSLLLICALLLFVVALRIIKSSRVCGSPAPPSNDQSKTRAKQNFISLPMPDDLSPPSPSKGDDLFSAAKEHSKKVHSEKIDETTGEPRYTKPPTCASTVFSTSVDFSTEKEKVYEALPV